CATRAALAPYCGVSRAAGRWAPVPMFFDPSDSTANRETVIPRARAAVAVGADGLLVDVHPYPERALCDGPQALLFDMFRDLVAQARAIAEIVKAHSDVQTAGAPAS